MDMNVNNGGIVLVEDPVALEACFEVISVLRPHLDRGTFLQQVERQRAQAYQMLAVFEDDAARSVAGFRINEHLAWGKILYIDDLCTHPQARSRGYAGQLLDWLKQYAVEQACQAIHLDSGYGRHDAHRLYLNKGFKMVSHHFSLLLN